MVFQSKRLKIIGYLTIILGIIFILSISIIYFNNWKSNQYYEEEITFYCRHKFIDCANENMDFVVTKVKDKKYSFLEQDMVSLRWKNNKKLDELRKTKSYLTSDFEVKGFVYKYKFDAAVSPLYDCELEAYRVDVIEINKVVN